MTPRTTRFTIAGAAAVLLAATMAWQPSHGRDVTPIIGLAAIAVGGAILLAYAASRPPKRSKARIVVLQDVPIQFQDTPEVEPEVVQGMENR